MTIKFDVDNNKTFKIQLKFSNRSQISGVTALTIQKQHPAKTNWSPIWYRTQWWQDKRWK